MSKSKQGYIWFVICALIDVMSVKAQMWKLEFSYCKCSWNLEGSLKKWGGEIDICIIYICLYRF